MQKKNSRSRSKETMQPCPRNTITIHFAVNQLLFGSFIQQQKKMQFFSFGYGDLILSPTRFYQHKSNPKTKLIGMNKVEPTQETSNRLE